MTMFLLYSELHFFVVQIDILVLVQPISILYHVFVYIFGEDIHYLSEYIKCMYLSKSIINILKKIENNNEIRK